jgi:hypothetical protein
MTVTVSSVLTPALTAAWWPVPKTSEGVSRVRGTDRDSHTAGTAVP